MEDIEDLVGAGAPPGLRLPVAAVGFKPKKKTRARLTGELAAANRQIPGTQVVRSLCPSFFSGFMEIIVLTCFRFIVLQTIYVKTVGCSHNQASRFSSLLLRSCGSDVCRIAFARVIN